MTIMVDRVIQVEVTPKPGEADLWVAIYPALGEMRRTLFASLETSRTRCGRI